MSRELPMITAVISFCSNDWRFLKRCIDGVASCCHEVILTVCDHFFDGSPENYALLEEAYARFPECTFLQFSFDPHTSYRPFSTLAPDHHNWRHEWHNTGRWLSSLYASPESQHLLFLDCDEIVDAPRFSDWLKETDLKGLAACRFTSASYYREARYEATSPSDNSLLVNRAYLTSALLWDDRERFGIFHEIEGEKKRGIKDLSGRPMVRHFSGVRTKEELHKKFTTWGHHWEQDWAALVEEEYSHPCNGEHFLGRQCVCFDSVVFDPLAEEIPALASVDLDQFLQGVHRFPNVIRVSRSEAFRKEVEREYL